MKHFILCLALMTVFVVQFNHTEAVATPISVSQGGTYLGNINPFTGGITGAANYNFFSWSAHPINGPAPVEKEAHIFMYDGLDGLNFTTVFSKEDSNNVGAGRVKWDISIAGSTTGTAVRLSDDGSELTETSADFYRGRWKYNNKNTDGGVIGEIGGAAWTITIDPIKYQNVSALKVFDYSGSFFSLNLNTDITGEIVLAAAAEPIPSPEPTTLLLMGIGIAGLAGAEVRRRRKRIQK